MSRRATVTRTRGSVHWVGYLGEEIPCAVDRRRNGRRGATGRVLPGDEVEIERQSDGTYVISDTRPRRNELAWARTHGRSPVSAANVDCMVIVESAVKPEFNRRVVDRLLAAAKRRGTGALVVVTKCDLTDESLVRSQVARLAEEGVDVVPTSAVSGAGLEAVRARLRGRISAIVGRPGVGKSRLVRALYPGHDPEADPAIATRRAELHPVPGGGYVVL